MITSNGFTSKDRNVINSFTHHFINQFKSAHLTLNFVLPDLSILYQWSRGGHLLWNADASFSGCLCNLQLSSRQRSKAQTQGWT